MAIIRPFRAWRSKEGKIPNDDELSREQLSLWKETGMILQDPLPGIYICYQQYAPFGDERKFIWKGFISMVRLSAPDKEDDGDIQLLLDSLPVDYQETYSELEQTLMHTVPARGMYEDPDQLLEPVMDHYMETPAIDFTDEQGVNYKLAIVQQKEDIYVFVQSLRARRIPFGTDLNRIAAARALRKQWKAQGKFTSEDSMVNYVPMFCSNLYGPEALAFSRALNENLQKEKPAAQFYPQFPTGLLFASIDDTENDSPFDACFEVSQTSTTAT